MADIDIRKRMAETNKMIKNVTVKSSYHSTTHYEWIEKLLETPIEDGRKYVLWKILCPYLVNIKKLEYEQTFSILKDWLEKCNKLRKLDFNPNIEIKSKLRRVKHYNPISIKKMKDDKTGHRRAQWNRAVVAATRRVHKRFSIAVAMQNERSG
ncbi:MAG TPA: DNA primase noncatalytic subunit PriX [Nitrososphaeraceae archaeon]